LKAGKLTKIPQYDKSKFDGEGDRVDANQWQEVNKAGDPKIQVVIFEGWCVGFRALGTQGVKEKWDKARAEEASGKYEGRLAYNSLENLRFVDEELAKYDDLTE
jgi:D-glycerate 3-kinase